MRARGANVVFTGTLDPGFAARPGVALLLSRGDESRFFSVADPDGSTGWQVRVARRVATEGGAGSGFRASLYDPGDATLRALEGHVSLAGESR